MWDMGIGRQLTFSHAFTQELFQRLLLHDLHCTLTRSIWHMEQNSRWAMDPTHVCPDEEMSNINLVSHY